MADPQQDMFEIDFYEKVIERSPSFIEAIELLGSLYNKTGRFSDGLRMDRRLIELEPHSPTAYYNFACSLALNRDLKPAVQALWQAIGLGYRDFDWLRNDQDLSTLQDHPDFQELMEQLNQMEADPDYTPPQAARALAKLALRADTQGATAPSSRRRNPRKPGKDNSTAA